MTGFYLFVSNKDSENFHPDNRHHDFIVELGRQYDLSDSGYVKSRIRWSVALVEIKIEDIKGGELPKLPEEVLLLCDLISPSFIKGTERNILRSVGITGSGHLVSTLKPYYIALNRLNFTRLKLHLVDKNLQRLTEKNGWPVNQDWKVTCTLHFQKI